MAIDAAHFRVKRNGHANGAATPAPHHAPGMPPPADTSTLLGLGRMADEEVSARGRDRIAKLMPPGFEWRFSNLGGRPPGGSTSPEAPDARLDEGIAARARRRKRSGSLAAYLAGLSSAGAAPTVGAPGAPSAPPRPPHVAPAPPERQQQHVSGPAPDQARAGGHERGRRARSGKDHARPSG